MKLISRRGFTSADVLVGLAVAVGTVGLGIPAVQKLRDADAKAKCEKNLQAIGKASMAFADANEGKLPHNLQTPTGSWNTLLLPYIDQEALSRKYAMGDDWWAPDSPNRDVVATRIGVYVCPAAPNPQRMVLTQPADVKIKAFAAAPTDYVGSAGVYYHNNVPKNLYPGAMHTRTINRRLRRGDIIDGASQTLLIVEMADKPNRWKNGKLSEARIDKPQMPALNGQWGAPNWNHLRSYSKDGDTQFGPCSVNCNNGASIYGFHQSGANVLFVDGSVRTLKAGLSQEMLVALVSIDGGEVLSRDEFEATIEDQR